MPQCTPTKHNNNNILKTQIVNFEYLDRVLKLGLFYILIISYQDTKS
jgi:hypothetical protein